MAFSFSGERFLLRAKLGEFAVGLLALAVLGTGCGGWAPLWVRRSRLDASIVDVMQGHTAGNLSVWTQGAIHPPFRIFAFTETRGCKILGTVVVKFLAGENPSEPPEVWVNRLGATAIESGDAVTAVLEEFSGEFSSSKEDKFVACIRKALRKAHPTVRFIPPDEFRQVAFPDLTPEDTPPEDWTWDRLVEDPGFQQRIAPLGLRYLIPVSGFTKRK